MLDGTWHLPHTPPWCKEGFDLALCRQALEGHLLALSHRGLCVHGWIKEFVSVLLWAVMPPQEIPTELWCSTNRKGIALQSLRMLLRPAALTILVIIFSISLAASGVDGSC